MLTSSGRVRSTRTITCLLAVALLTAAEAYGQFKSLRAPDTAVRGERVNLFAEWSGNEAVDGFLLELPSGWSLDSTTVLRNGYQRVNASVLHGDGHRYRVELSEAVRGAHVIVLHLWPENASAQDRVVLTPLRRSDREFVPETAHRKEVRLRVTEPSEDRSNRVAAFAGNRPGPVVLRRGVTPDLDANRGYTVSMWMKTARLREVIFSTWNGDDRRSYPLELTVDASGRLRAFRGRPGEHRSLVAPRPVADGAWHHLEFSNDPSAGWMRLSVDGRTVDSLYVAAPAAIDMELPIVLGGRSDGPSPYFDGLAPFSGRVDELRVAPVSGEGLVLDFEEPVSANLLEQPGERLRYEFDDLGRRHDIESFRAIPGPAGVTLSWTADAPRTHAFAVERSYDGRSFERIERVPVDRSGNYRIVDVQVSDRVVYYRIRQVFEDGSERITGMLRVGMGADQRSSVILLGNFPNPFNATSTISYQVRESTPVHLAVWDLSGQLVATLVDQTVEPGVYEARFEAGDLPSGTYFARLRTPTGTVSHKMILMK